MEIVTLYPFNQVTSGGYDPNINTVDFLRGPDVFGGGSVSDDSDTSYVEIGTRFDGTQPSGQEEHPDLFLVDFAIDPGVHPNPTWMYVSVRAKDASVGGAVWDGVSLPQYGFYRTDDPTGQFIYYQNWPDALASGGQAEVAWFDQVYNHRPILDGEPGDATNWLNLPRDWPELLDPLTTTGLRVGIFATSSSVTREALLDVYEVRLVVACDAAVGYITAMRQVQRGDGYGIGGVPRAVSSRTRQASLRSGPGAVL